MLGYHWLLSAMVLTSSPSVECYSCAAGMDPAKALPSGVMTPIAALLSEAEGHQLEPPEAVSEDEEKVNTSDVIDLGGGVESVNSSSRGMTRRKTLIFRNLRAHESGCNAFILTGDAIASQMLRAVESQELKNDDLLLAWYRRENVSQDLLHNPVKEVQLNTADDGVKSHNGHLSQPKDRLYPLALTRDSNNSRTFHSRASAGDLSLVELVLYLISLTSGRQLYLVYDDVTPGVEDVVRGALHEVLGDTILLPYEPSLLLLTEALTSNYHVQPMRNVFILCSAINIVNIFELVRERVLESPTIQWFVIVDQDMKEDLILLLREGTQVALVQRVTPQKAQLFSSRVNPDGQIRFHFVGWWSANGSWLSKSLQAKGGLLPDLQELYSDFQGRQLIITTINHWPYFKTKKLENGTIVPISGIEFNILNALGEKLNFIYEVTTSPDRKWGGPKPDGTITGLVGQVARHEAHATACELTITDIRESVVDFTMPYYMETMTLVSPAPKEKNRSFAILSPFTVEVWLYILVVTVLMGPLLYTVSRLLVSYLEEEDDPHYSLQSFSFNMFRNLVLQGNLIESHRWSLRFNFICWYLFCLYIYAMYSGTLTAALAIISFEKPIDSLYDLERAKTDGYTIAIGRDTNYEATFRRAKSGIFMAVWQLFDHKDRDKSFVTSQKIGYDRVEKYKYVYIKARLNARLKTTQRGRQKFHIARETFLPQGYGIACSSGSPFKDVFSRVLIRMVEVGLVDKWINDEVNKVSQFVPTSSDSGPNAISLQHLQAAFFIVALGYALSALVLVLELVIKVWVQSNKQQAYEEGYLTATQ